MSDNISKQTIKALLPPGIVWVPKGSGGFDLLIDGIAASTEVIRTDIANVALVRAPLFTDVLDDLEKEYGVTFDPALTETERRIQLQAVKSAGNGTGTASFMETKLTEAGFDLQVHVNDPPVDPEPLIADAFKIYFAGTPASTLGAYFGNDNFVLGRSDGLLIVNGDGFIDPGSLSLTSEYWPFVFFVGGDATRNVSGELTSVANGQVAGSRVEELIRLITKYKPMHSWCALNFDRI